MTAASSRHFMMALHDISPATWDDYRPFVEEMDARDVRMTWLVVPDFHHRSPTFEDPKFLALLESRLARGDELVLHGFYHCDDGPAPRSAREYFMRRLYTYEGEFYGLDHSSAKARLEEGISLFERQGWPLHGFVAPAWLMSQATRHALSNLPLRYTTDTKGFYHLPHFEHVPVPTLCWSARAKWRRGMSYVVNTLSERRYSKGQALRLGLHPVDMRHDISRRYWLDAVERLQQQGFTSMTKYGWLFAQQQTAQS